jgi:hypothetical protein
MRGFGDGPMVGSAAGIRHIRSACALMLLALAQPVGAQATNQDRAANVVEPVGAALCDDMKLHHVLGSNPPVGCDRLRLIRFAYVGFDEQLHEDGEIVVMDAAAAHVLRIFATLRERRFPIAKARLLNHYEGDDDASMNDNNTSAFNHRSIANGESLSLHAYGLAIDINPVQNPYLVRSNRGLVVAPASGADFINRLDDRPWKKSPRPGMAESVIDVFADNGFLIWGGYWDDPIDYQHFQVGRKMAEHLASSPPQQAEAIFNDLVERYRECRRPHSGKPGLGRIQCIMQADPTAE